MDSEPTTALLGRAKAGSGAALDELYRRCAGKLLALIRLRMGPSLRAHLQSQDILQATLLKSYEKRGEFQGSDRDSLMAWLAAIARHEILDQADRQGRQRRDAGRETGLGPRAEAVPAEVRSALSQAIWSEQASRLEQALESLPEAYREVIVLRKLEERPFAEIGARLGRSEDACRMLFARAMTALTLAMNGPPPTPAGEAP
jgi:RNA polymerase sigma-70 factor, ECF subfamily